MCLGINPVTLQDVDYLGCVNYLSTVHINLLFCSSLKGIQKTTTNIDKSYNNQVYSQYKSATVTKLYDIMIFEIFCFDFNTWHIF